MTFDPTSPWPELPLAAWRPTRDTLHMWTQIVGKTALARAPVENHWWHSALRVCPVGLVTQRLVDGQRTFDVQLDLVHHALTVRTSDGGAEAMPLAPRTVRSFYDEYMKLLGKLDLDVHLWTTPVEVPDPIPFDRDEVHREYDAPWASRFGEVLRRCDAALQALASSFVGKRSPVHFFWGSFDLAATRFSGRRAPERPQADPVTREAYSHEVISFGFWPGGSTPTGEAVDEPVFYAYAAPEPDGFREVDLRLPHARYDTRLSEFFLPYEAVRTSSDPASMVRDFCERVYEAGATLGGWDRETLERPGRPPPPHAAEEHVGLHPSTP